jgi:hypothetical protein
MSEERGNISDTLWNDPDFQQWYQSRPPAIQDLVRRVPYDGNVLIERTLTALLATGNARREEE